MLQLPQGLRHSPIASLGVLGHNRKWILLETKKENSGVSGRKETRLHRKHPGSGWRAQGRYCLLSPSVRRIRLRLGEGRHALYSPKIRLLLLATSRKTEVWKRCYPALRTGGGSPTACGILDRRLSGGWATSQRGESLSGYPACPYPTPRGRPPAPPYSAPASQPARENPVVRLPHPCENPDAGVPILFSTRFLQGPWHASPSLYWRT